MVKLPFDLSANPYSTKRPCSESEITMLKEYFSSFAENSDLLPDKTFSDMADIEKQFISNYYLSDKQIEYVQRTYDKFIVGSYLSDDD